MYSALMRDVQKSKITTLTSLVVRYSYDLEDVVGVSCTLFLHERRAKKRVARLLNNSDDALLAVEKISGPRHGILALPAPKGLYL